MEKAKISKKRTAIVAAVLCLALAAGLGTYAWLTAQSSLTNTFTVGSINNPDHKPDPTDPTKPDPDGAKPAGNLTETKWNADTAKLTPGATIEKNPNVGIGAKSEDSYVFVYVKNALVNDKTDPSTPYFTLNNGWSAVAGETTTNGTDGHYTGGLFMYTFGTDTTTPALLKASATEDVYTGELFSNVVVPGTLESGMINASNGKADMTVSCYIFGGNQADGDTDAAANALAQAKAWAATQAA